MADRTDWVVEGYQFATEQDAKLARGEKSRVQRLEERLDYNNLEMIDAVYRKAVDNRVFKTPIGYEYLKKLQAILREVPVGDGKTPAIPVNGVHSLRDSTEPVLERIRASKSVPKTRPEKKTIAIRTSMLINAALLIMVALMLWISTTGSNPNILNYERALQNKYSQWEKELSERENAVREKERALLLEE